MKQLFLFIGFFVVYSLFGQINQGGMPLSYKNRSEITLKATAKIPVFTTQELETKRLLEEDEEFPSPYRYSVFEDVSIPIKSLGLKTELADNSGTMWRYQFEGGEAKSLQIYFEKFNLPKGAKLFLYNPDYSIIHGAFSHENNNQTGSLILAAFEDKEVVVEYFEPKEAEFDGELIIGAIGKGYKDIHEKSTSLDESGLINVNCPEGENWQDQKHAVCKLTFKIGKFGYTCTGSLINNTRNDGTPYFMTANHCIDNANAAKTVVAYFNYEQTGCFGPRKLGEQTLSGSTFMTTGQESDFTLLKFERSLPNSYQPYFAGWDVTGSAGESAVGIHHPGGDVKKICVDNDPPESYEYQISWEDNIVTPAHSHWLSVFELGVTYGGSSGSPLYNDKGRYIGQLHGGSNTENYYGKISHSWRNNTKKLNTLKSYLDPDNTGLKTLDAYYPSTNIPDPQFYADFTTVCQNAPIHLKAYSAFDPLNWKWVFSPDSVTYLDSSSSTSPQPYVMFKSGGYYTVSLQATNASGTETTVLDDFILADTSLNIQVFTEINSDSCLCDFDSIQIKGYGATSFQWQLDKEFSDIFYIVDTLANPATIKALPDTLPNKTIEINLQVTGKHGQCTTQSDHTLELIGQENDNIANALQIEWGQNGVYSNICSTIEENEPIPPFSSCTGQDSWCDEYGTGENIVEHSVWFYYLAEASDELMISSKGFDNQVAVYQAETFENILAGSYELIGANDDYTDENFNPIITNIQVEKGKKYWIQVDGSGGGTEGKFYLNIDKSTDNKDLSVSSPELKVYPIPSDGVYFLESEMFLSFEPVNVEIFNLAGQKIVEFNKLYPESNTIQIDLTHIQQGIYLSRITTSDKVYTSRLIKQ